MGGDGILDDEFIKQAGDAANGSFACMPAAEVNALPEARSFLDEYKSAYSDTTGGYILYSAQAYEATNIIIDAIKRAGNTDREAVRAAIAATKDYNGIFGSTSFDQNGDTTNRWISVYQVVDGKWQLNLYDPNLTRAELMEFKPVQKPCCSSMLLPEKSQTQ